MSEVADSAAAIAEIIPYATARPSAAPTAAATTSYARPSNTNPSTRWPRRVPTARATPISVRRSAASITKIRKISRTPAAIENVPNVEKSDRNDAPCSSAASIPSCLAASTARPVPASIGRTSARTSSVWAAPDSSSPRLEIRTWLIRPGWSTIAWARASGIRTAAVSVPAPWYCTTSRTVASTRLPPDVDPDPVAGVDAEVAAAAFGHVHLAGSQCVERDGRTVEGAHLTEPVERRGVGREQRGRGFGLTGGEVLDGDGLDDGRRDPVDERVTAEATLQRRRDALVEVAACRSPGRS